MSDFCPKCKAVHADGTPCENPDEETQLPPLFTQKVLAQDLPSPDYSVNFHCRFHKGRPLRVAYGRGILVIICSKCNQLVAHFKIAEE